MNRFVKCMDQDTRQSFIKMNGRRLLETDTDYNENMMEFHHQQVMEGNDAQWHLYQAAQLRLKMVATG